MKLEPRLSNRSSKRGEEKTAAPQVTSQNGHHHHRRFTAETTTTTKPPLTCSSSLDSLRFQRDLGGEAGVEEEEKETCVGKFSSCRWMTGYVCCAARFAQVAIRQCIGMAVVCMTLSRGNDPHHHVNVAPAGGGGAGGGGGDDGFAGSPVTHEPMAAAAGVSFRNETAVNVPEFVWSSEFEALVLNGFTFGFFFSPILGGHLAGRFGGKRVVLVALLVGSLVTICLPLASSVSDVSIVLLRVLAGLFLGVVDPAIQTLWSQWATRTEKARLTTCSFTGVSLAGIATFFISAYLCSIRLFNGWPFIFYFFGGFAFLCILPWVLLIYDSPEQHPRISIYEKTLIIKGRALNTRNKKLQTPWREMLSSGPVWAIVVSHATYSWVTTWMMSYLPKYLKEMMEFDVKEDGLYSSLPYVGRMLAGFLCGYLSDRLLRSGLLTTGQCRKLFQVIGCAGCAVCMLAVGFLDHTARASAVVLLVLALSFQNFTSVAFRINHLDIAPRFAGVMMGISLTAAMAFSLTGPPVTAAIVTQGKQEEWLGVFAIVASLNVIGALVFFFLGSGEVQSWALPPKQDDHPVVSVVVLEGRHPADTPDVDFPQKIVEATRSVDGKAFAQPVGFTETEEDREPLRSVPISAGKLDTSSEAGDSRSSYSEDSAYDQDTVSDSTGAEDEQNETISAGSPSNSMVSSSAKRALSHTVSMPVQYVGGVNKHSMLRKRISSTDVHQQNIESKLRHSTSAKSPLSAEPDDQDDAKR